MARDTNDQDFAARRQRFLAEAGYAHEIVDGEDVLAAAERRHRQARTELAGESAAGRRVGGWAGGLVLFLLLGRHGPPHHGGHRRAAGHLRARARAQTTTVAFGLVSLVLTMAALAFALVRFT